MKGERSISMSFKAGPGYRRAIKNLADDLGMSVADFMRSAVDSAYGSKLQPYLQLFFALNEEQIPQTRSKSAVVDSPKADA